MALEDTVIVKYGDVAVLYKKSPEKYVKPLEDLGFLPLTVKDLCTKAGNALLHFASWVYFSGDLHPTKFRPHIRGKAALLEKLVKEKFSAMKQEFRITKRGAWLAKNGGIFGRLLYCMGVPLPKGTHGSRKPYYSRDLPHYITDVMTTNASSEVETNEKRKLLAIIANILVKDRLKKTRNHDWRKDHYYLMFNHHTTEERARTYAKQIVDFLNTVFAKGNYQHVFNYNAISVFKQCKKDRVLFKSELRLSDENLGYLITKEPRIISATVAY